MGLKEGQEKMSKSDPDSAIFMEDTAVRSASPPAQPPRRCDNKQTKSHTPTLQRQRPLQMYADKVVHLSLSLFSHWCVVACCVAVTLQVDVKRKIKRAFCPPEQVKDNPCLDWLKHVVFPRNGSWTVARKPDNGGDRCVYGVSCLHTCSNRIDMMRAVRYSL